MSISLKSQDYCLLKSLCIEHDAKVQAAIKSEDGASDYASLDEAVKETSTELDELKK